MTMNFSQFMDNWPESRKEQFSYQAMRALFDYLEEYEESTGEKVEFDPIAICCEYSEYENLAELQNNYTDIKDMDDLKDHTQVIEIENSEAFIIQNY